MPRTDRIDFRGARHHVMNRGARRAPIFEDEDARALFLEVLAELPERFAVVVHGYVIMPNHYHLMLSTPRANLSRAMRHLGALYSQRLNARMGWDGPVFRGRFRNRIVPDHAYWRHLVAYLHINPVPSLVQRPEDWRWSSHRAYAGLDPEPEWLTTAGLIHEFGSRRSLLQYVEDQRTGRFGPPVGWDPEDLWARVPTEVMHGRDPEDVDVRPVLTRDAFREVEEVTGVPEDTFATPRRGRRDNRARWLAAWWLGRRAALTHREIARYLGCRAPGVANMLLRIHAAERAGDEQIVAWMEALRGKARAAFEAEHAARHAPSQRS